MIELSTLSCDSYIASWSLITVYTMLRNTVDDTPCIGHKSISVRCPCTTPPKKIHKPTPTSKPTPEVTVADRVPAKCDFSQRARQVEFRRKALAHTLFTVIQQIIFRRKVSAHADFNISKHGLMVVPGGIICTLFNFNLQENHIPPATSYSPILKYFFLFFSFFLFLCHARPRRSFEDLAILPNGTVNEAYRPLAISQYHVHVHRWLEVFSREQLLVVNGDQLIEDPVSQLRRIEDFLGE